MYKYLLAEQYMPANGTVSINHYHYRYLRVLTVVGLLARRRGRYDVVPIILRNSPLLVVKYSTCLYCTVGTAPT